MFDEDIGDDIETPTMFAKSLEGQVCDNLTQSSTDLILLLASWTTDCARIKFDIFPEFVAVDDTENVSAVAEC